MPAIVRPWDDPLRVLSGPNYYDFEPRDPDPIRGAPTQDPWGGVLYFDDNEHQERLETALEVIGVRLLERDFAVFAGSAQDTLSERYLDQVRIVPKPALKHLFGAGESAG